MSFTAIITADAKSFEQAIERAQKQIDGLEKSVGRNLDSISEKFTDIGKKMTVVSAGIIAGLGVEELRREREEALKKINKDKQEE